MNTSLMHMLFSYLTPEQMIPLATPITAVVGAALFSWRYVSSSVTSWFSGQSPSEMAGLSDDFTEDQLNVISMSAAHRLQPEKIAMQRPARRAA
jgi:hypothetical protein